MRRFYPVLFLILIGAAVFVSRHQPFEARFAQDSLQPPQPIREEPARKEIDSISPKNTAPDLSFNPSPAREIVSLTGEWDFQPSDLVLSEPSEDRWEDTKVIVPIPWNANGFTEQWGGDFTCRPSYPKTWNTVRAGWMRRTFTGPKIIPGDRWFLRFNGAAHKTVVFVNKRKAGENDDGFTPFELEITNLIVPEKSNEILVGCAGWESFSSNARRNLPCGSFWGFHVVGLWQGVSLVRRPGIFVRNCFVETSVSSGAITVSLSLDAGSQVEDHVRLVNQILPWQPGKTVQEWQIMFFSAEDFDVEENTLSPVSNSLNWNTAELWTPEKPSMYVLRTRLLNAQGGIIDELSTRFGFREVEFRDNLLYLNGDPVRLRGDAWHYMGSMQQSRAYARTWYKLAKDTGLNCIRLHAQPYPSFYLDLADELGMLIIDESALWASGLLMDYDGDFRTRYISHLHSLVLRDRNHPSNIMWSVANETIAAHKVDPNDGIEYEGELATMLSGAIGETQTLDPTRPVYSDGDEDIFGLLPTISFHYPHTLDNPEIPKPVLIGEAGPMHYARPDIVSEIAGESVYADRESWLAGIGDYVDGFFSNYRRWAALTTPFNTVWYTMEPVEKVSGNIFASHIDEVSPERIPPCSITLDPVTETWRGNGLYNRIRSLMKPVAVFPRTDVARVPSEATKTVLVAVHSDLGESVDLALNWKATLGETTFATGAMNDSFSPSEWRDIAVDLSTPPSQSIRRGLLSLELNSGQGLEATCEIPIEVYPKRTRVQIPNREGVRVFYIGSNEIPHWLPDARMLYEIPDTSIDDRDVLVIGEDKIITPAEGRWLQERAQDGLRILALGPKQTVLDSFGLTYRPEIAPSAYGFIMDSRHPIFEGLSDYGFSRWEPTRSIADWHLSGPAGRMAFPLLSVKAGQTALTEIPDGLGCLMICCLSVDNAIPDDPAAIAFLQNVLNYLAGYEPELARPTYVLGGPNGRPYFPLDFPALLSIPKEFLQPETSREHPPGVLIVDPAVLRDNQDLLDSSKALASEGWSAIVVNTTPETLPYCETLVGSDLTLEPTGIQSLVKASDHGLLAGIHNDDLYWFEPSISRPIMTFGIPISSLPPESEVLMKTPELDWRTWAWRPEMVKTTDLWRSAKNPEDLAGLVRIPFGKGEFLICQISPEQDYLKWQKTTGILLSNLGVFFFTNTGMEGFARSTPPQ